MNRLTFGILILTASICTAASLPNSDYVSKRLMRAAFSSPPASFETHVKGKRINVEVCFDRCYEFEGDSRHAREYWDAVVVFMGTVGNWNVPDDFKQKLSDRLREIEASETSGRCGKTERVSSCIGRALAASAGLKAWEVNYDEGNACATNIDVPRTFESMAVVTSGSTHCRRVTS